MNIVAVGAHPDDIEIICGGTMAKYVQKGHKVTFIIVTNGEGGSLNLPKSELNKINNKEKSEGKKVNSFNKSSLLIEDIVEIRYEEAKAGAKTIGAGLIWLGYKDNFLFDCEETRKGVLNALRKTKADVVFTHYQDYYNADHNTTSKILIGLKILQNFKSIPTEYPPTVHNPHLYFMDTYMGIGFEPDEYVDITDVFEIKKNALLAHKSQSAVLSEYFNVDYVDLIETQAKFRGHQSNVKYAEAFKGAKAWPSGIIKSLLPQYL